MRALWWTLGGLAAAGGGTYLVTRMFSGDASDLPVPRVLEVADLEALARVIASEAGGEPIVVQHAVAWAVKNYAGNKGKSIADVVAPAGVFGRQGTGGRGYVSSRQAPTDAHRAVAAAVLAGDVRDPTGGATHFDSPRAQRALEKKDPLYTKSPEEVARARVADGFELVVIDGVPEERFRAWRPT